MNADFACEKISGPGGRNYKIATGEMVEGQGRFRVRCQSAWGHLLHMTAEKTSVHKPLLSAGDVTDKGHALWLSWARRIPSDNFGVQVQAHWVPGCDTGTRKGHECLCSGLLYWMAARIGMETIVVEVR